MILLYYAHKPDAKRLAQLAYAAAAAAAAAVMSAKRASLSVWTLASHSLHSRSTST